MCHRRRRGAGAPRARPAPGSAVGGGHRRRGAGAAAGGPGVRRTGRRKAPRSGRVDRCGCAAGGRCGRRSGAGGPWGRRRAVRGLRRGGPGRGGAPASPPVFWRSIGRAASARLPPSGIGGRATASSRRRRRGVGRRLVGGRRCRGRWRGCWCGPWVRVPVPVPVRGRPWRGGGSRHGGRGALLEAGDALGQRCDRRVGVRSGEPDEGDLERDAGVEGVLDPDEGVAQQLRTRVAPGAVRRRA